MILNPMLCMLAEQAALENGKSPDEAKFIAREYALTYALRAQGYQQTCRAIEALAKRSGLKLVDPNNDGDRAECDFG